MCSKFIAKNRRYVGANDELNSEALKIFPAVHVTYSQREFFKVSLSRSYLMFTVRKTAATIMSLIMLVTPVTLLADTVTPVLKSKVDRYKQLLGDWALDPNIIAAVRNSNASGGAINGMSNSKWNYLDANDPMVTQFRTSQTASLIMQWESVHQGVISAIYLRDNQGNLVASSRAKPPTYNNKTKLPFEMAMKGIAWAADEIESDAGTQVRGVEVSAPVMDKGKPIGILHTIVIAK